MHIAFFVTLTFFKNIINVTSGWYITISPVFESMLLNETCLLFGLFHIDFLNGAGKRVEPQAGGVALVEEGAAEQFHVPELSCRVASEVEQSSI